MRALAIIMFLLAAAACSKETHPDGSDHDAARTTSAHADEPEHESLPKRVRLGDKVIQDAGIRTTAVVREVLQATIALPGEIAADPDRSARVSPPVAGRIAQVNFREGSAVKKGDVLAILRVPDLGQSRAAYSATSAKAAAARANADRLEALAAKRLAATQEVVAAKAEADALEAEARADREQLQATGAGETGGPQLTLRAPVSGVVIARDAVVGQAITPETTIARITDLSEAWFLARVFEKDLGRVRAGAAAEVQLNAYPSEPLSGAVDYLGHEVDPVARTVTARIRVPNREDVLRIGLFGIARVATSDQENKSPALVVPRSAVTEIADKQVVFVREPDGDFEMHEVVLGDASVGKVAVVSGLREGEPVVMEGVFTLKSAVLKGTFGEEGE